jgi:hypothetical protein
MELWFLTEKAAEPLFFALRFCECCTIFGEKYVVITKERFHRGKQKKTALRLSFPGFFREIRSSGRCC